MAARKKTDVSPRKQPLQARAVDTIDALLRATAHILERDGYDRLTTNRVAEKAGVSIGSLYQYFPNKDALVLAVGERHFDEMRAILHAHLLPPTAARGLAETVDAVLRTLVAIHAKEPRLHAALSERALRTGILRRRAAHLEEDLYRPLLAYVAAHPGEIAVEDPEMAVFVLTHSVEATLHAFILDEEPTPERAERMIATLGTMIVRFLAAGARPSPSTSNFSGSGDAGDGGPTRTGARPFATASEFAESGVARDGGASAGPAFPPHRGRRLR